MDDKNKVPPASPGGLRLETPVAAAERLGLVGLAGDPKRAVLRMVRMGQLRSVRVGKFILIDPRSVDAFILSGCNAAAPPVSRRPKQYRSWQRSRGPDQVPERSL